MRRAARGRGGIVVIDGADQLVDETARDRVAAALWDASIEASVTVVISATDAETARALLAAAGRTDVPVLELTPPAEPARALSTTEVNA
ncbi:hypothetical protein [Agromyces terreus]|uniref:hypothetical protein n=1 Tax=Agromyces terreus TaxID=424795 RepID=UPI0031DEDF31